MGAAAWTKRFACYRRCKPAACGSLFEKQQNPPTANDRLNKLPIGEIGHELLAISSQIADRKEIASLFTGYLAGKLDFGAICSKIANVFTGYFG